MLVPLIMIRNTGEITHAFVLFIVILWWGWGLKGEVKRKSLKRKTAEDTWDPN